jgi:RNA polymerase sigma-70 factor (ECF subfamily)
VNSQPEPTGAWTSGWPQSRQEVAAVVEAYADRLVRHAFRRLGNLQDAEDVVQDVFVRAFADRARQTEVAAAGPYLYRSVANACTDLLRGRSSAAVYREEVAAGELLGGSLGPAEAAQAAEELRRAESLLRRLPDEQAEAIRLRVFDELRLSEIAEVAGCSINTVCSRLRYGFQRLRGMVEEKRE